MTPEEQAVIDAAKAYRANTTGMTGTTWADLNRALSALEDLENPQPVVFPDPPTDHIAFQRIDGPIWHHKGTDRNPNVWRELRVTYTPMDEPSPLERIAELMDSNLRMLNRIAELEAEVLRVRDYAERMDALAEHRLIAVNKRVGA